MHSCERVWCKISFLLSFKTFWTSFSTFRVVADGPVQGLVVSREAFVGSQSSQSSFSVSLFLIESYCRQLQPLIAELWIHCASLKNVEHSKCFPNLRARKFDLTKTFCSSLEDVYLVQSFSKKFCFLFLWIVYKKHYWVFHKFGYKLCDLPHVMKMIIKLTPLS